MVRIKVYYQLQEDTPVLSLTTQGPSQEPQNNAEEEVYKKMILKVKTS